MPNSIHPIYRRISHTPLRDVLRLRFTGRLDWKFRLAAADLPGPAKELIERVVRRTRLWWLEQAQVADELIAHFSDGVSTGCTAEQLIERFGDERLAAKLIRRAKRRGRPWAWQLWNIAFRATAVVLAIYALLLIRFCVGKPSPSVDYVAKLNAPILSAPESDRAWPLWRQVILATSDGVNDGSLTFPANVFDVDSSNPLSPAAINWIDAHAPAIELARQAARKPLLGFILGPDGSMRDPDLMFRFSQDRDPPLVAVLLPHLNSVREMGCLLSTDAKRAAEKADGAVVEADITSMLGLARQTRESDGFIITQNVAIGLNDLTLDRLRSVLLNFPGLLTDEQLIRIAHAISGPRVAADLVTLTGERCVFPDIAQRAYTDDGHGDGRMTLIGLRTLPMIAAITAHANDWQPPPWAAYALASTLPGATASRAKLMEMYKRLMDEDAADLRQPIREVDFRAFKALTSEFFGNSPIDRLAGTPLIDHTESIVSVQSYCERYLGQRDGVVVGIALELYRRHHGHYPAVLGELTPGLLPEIPADRITGDPVKYKLIEGQPIVYSVGADRVDDGGRLPEMLDPRSRNVSAARWGIDPSSAPRGDWLLFAPDSEYPGGY